jgi:ATP-dependent DNA helicase RecG
MAEAAPPSNENKPKSAPQRALEKLGLTRDIDLALHLPLRYEDETQLTPIAALRDGDIAQVEGVVTDSRVQFRPRRQLVVKLHDGANDLVLRFLHFYPSHQKTLAEGARVRVRGEARGGFFGLEMVHPSFKAVSEGAPLARALTPVYPSTAQLPQAYLRKAVVSALQRAHLGELLPPGTAPAGLPSLREAVLYLHQPPPQAELHALQERTHPAWQRLKWEELLAQQLSQLQAQHERAQLRAPALRARDGGLRTQLHATLPFALTAAQARVVAEIAADLARPQPMNRLLQGDVGSGKTVVAALAALQAIESGMQVAFMAPTEILAEQHYRKLAAWLDGLGIPVAWLTGTLPAKARRQAIEGLASGAIPFAVGTHALFQEGVEIPRLGLAIVDEQHRFGVAQRLALRGKGLAEAHQLMMSATPIPRTLAMSFYADLDVSVIDEMPPGRTPVATRLVSQKRRPEIVQWVGKQCAEGRQAYWVCPLIEESEKLELQTAVALHAELTAALPALRVGLIHGRRKPDEKAATMAAFTRGEVDILVATTVIEVGVDVPNASLMVIEHAERFGLAQLHQLRGRVGRGAAESTCVLLFEEPLGEVAKLRLKVIFESTDGFEIARQDLLIRGPGELMGARQSGVPLLRFADLERDVELIEKAQVAADEMLARDPAAAQAHLTRWLGGRADFIKA